MREDNKVLISLEEYQNLTEIEKSLKFMKENEHYPTNKKLHHALSDAKFDRDLIGS